MDETEQAPPKSLREKATPKQGGGGESGVGRGPAQALEEVQDGDEEDGEKNDGIELVERARAMIIYESGSERTIGRPVLSIGAQGRALEVHRLGRRSWRRAAPAERDFFLLDVRNREDVAHCCTRSKVWAVSVWARKASDANGPELK